MPHPTITNLRADLERIIDRAGVDREVRLLAQGLKTVVDNQLEADAEIKSILKEIEELRRRPR